MVTHSEKQGILGVCEQRQARFTTRASSWRKRRELARKTAGSVTAVLLGHDVLGLAGDLVAHGADRVWVIDDQRLAVYRLLAYASVSKKLCLRHPDVFLFGAAPRVELAPRLAAMLNTGLSAHCIDLKLDEQERLLQVVPGWGGGAVATIRCEKGRPSMATAPGCVQERKTGRPARRDPGCSGGWRYRSVRSPGS